MESLIRWKHPSYGLIPAPITVALAEDSGLIRPIGLWVFETACQVRKSWLDAGITDRFGPPAGAFLPEAAS